MIGMIDVVLLLLVLLLFLFLLRPFLCIEG